MSSPVHLGLDGAPPDEAQERPGGPGRRQAAARRLALGLRSWWPVLVPVVVVLVGAWLYRWVDEDAFINFRVIDNFLAGHGLVFNVGERVEVDSDPLWVLTLAGFHEVLPFMALEWLSVVLGLVCTGLGFAVGGRAAQRLGATRGEHGVLPVGLLVASAVAGVWEFATSGLEMSMVFLWLGVSFLGLVRVADRRDRAVLPAVAMGLGPLIRPELALMSAVFLAALVVVVASPGWRGPAGAARRYVAPVAAALALPVAYQVFRMAYYALLVPNTGLAKAAGSTWWSQGLAYLGNLVGPYVLWVPFLLAVPVVAGRVGRWWRAGDRIGVLVLATPVAAGVVDLLYVVAIGGDYMHARLLLPALFAVCLAVFADRSQVRSLLALPLLGIAVWAVVCAGWLRYATPAGASLDPRVVAISNERDNWVSATGDPHPVTASDYAAALSGKAGTALRRAAAATPAGHQRLLVITDPFAPIRPAAAVPASSPLPFSLVANIPAIGVIGYVSGPRVYIDDAFSLANPIGSHTAITVHARPGHEKHIGPAWMLARFGVAGEPLPPGSPPAATIDAARAAIGCGPLRSYLHAITAPLTVGRALSDIADSFGFTTMSFSADPVVAARQLCGGNAGSRGG